MALFPVDDPVARLHGRAAFFDALQSFWARHPGPRPTMFQPKVNGHHIDLYTLFEAARALGGLYNVKASRLFYHLRTLLNIPDSAAVYFHQVRDCYIRFCQPCDNLLTNAVETAYETYNLHSTNPSWIYARIDAADPTIKPSVLIPNTATITQHQQQQQQQPNGNPISSNNKNNSPVNNGANSNNNKKTITPGLQSETVPSKRKSQSSISDDDNDIDNDHATTLLDTDDDDEILVAKYPEATRAAVRARMNVNQLEESERKCTLFPASACALLRVDLRNHVIRMWYRNPCTRLVVRAAVQDVPLIYQTLATQVFTLLECMGTINFGAISFNTPLSMSLDATQPMTKTTPTPLCIDTQPTTTGMVSVSLENGTAGDVMIPLSMPMVITTPPPSRRRRVCVIGAGISGLITARQLRSFGISVTIYEAKNRAGGRIYTENSKFSAPVDLGAMIITGTTQNPLSILAEQTHCQTHPIGQNCPLFDIDGSWVPTHIDDWAQREYNAVLSATDRYRKKEAEDDSTGTRNTDKLSLGVAFQKCLTKRIRKRQGHVRRVHLKVNAGVTKDSRKDADDRHVNKIRILVPQTAAGSVYDDGGGNVMLSADDDDHHMNNSNNNSSSNNIIHSNSNSINMNGHGSGSINNKHDGIARRSGIITSGTNSGRRRSDRLKMQKCLASDVQRRRQRCHRASGSSNGPAGTTHPGSLFEESSATTKKEVKKPKKGSSAMMMMGEENSDDRKHAGAQISPKDDHLIGRLLRWHIANLEYACAAPIETVSLKHWDQDDPYAFQGDHAFSKQGFQPLVAGLVKGLENDIELNTEVTRIRRCNNWDHVVIDTKPTTDDPCASLNSTSAASITKNNNKKNNKTSSTSNISSTCTNNINNSNNSVHLHTPPSNTNAPNHHHNNTPPANSSPSSSSATPESREFDAVVVTIPLGVLKDDTLVFDPPLPPAKRNAIRHLGTGGLMKVAMEFNTQFWHRTDTFGALRQSIPRRGSFYLFWNMANCLGKPILIGMVAEPVVQSLAGVDDALIVDEAMAVLRRRYPLAPDPVAYSVTRWSEDRFIRGAYTNIPVGSSGLDYDALAEPVPPYIFFAGEHTCRTNPTTCASGILSGLREAYRIARQFGLVDQIAQAHQTALLH